MKGNINFILVLNSICTIKIKNNIHEIIYLGELEKCITASLRMEIRGILYRTFNYSIKDNHLALIYNLPEDTHNEKRMIFQRINKDKE